MAKSGDDIAKALTKAGLTDAKNAALIQSLVESGVLELVQDMGAAVYAAKKFPILTTAQILDRLIAETDAVSDYSVARLLDISRATVSRWRVGKGTMGDDTAQVAAKLLGEDPDYLLACLNAERSQSAASRYGFSRLARLAKGLSIVKKAQAAALSGLAVITLVLSAPVENVQAAQGLERSGDALRSIHYTQ